MMKGPIFGVGPNHWGTIVVEYGFPEGKEAHNLWLQTAAELGLPGVLFLSSFYLLCIVRLWPVARDKSVVADPWLSDGARMVIASLSGFAISASFVTLPGLEVPFYIVLIGGGVLRISSQPSVATLARLASRDSISYMPTQ